MMPLKLLNLRPFPNMPERIPSMPTQPLPPCTTMEIRLRPTTKKVSDPLTGNTLVALRLNTMPLKLLSQLRLFPNNGEEILSIMTTVPHQCTMMVMSTPNLDNTLLLLVLLTTRRRRSKSSLKSAREPMILLTLMTKTTLDLLIHKTPVPMMICTLTSLRPDPL